MKKVFIILASILIAASLFAFDNELSCMAIKPGTNELYVGGTFTSIFVVDIKTGETLKSITTEQGINDMQFSPDGKYLIGATSNKVYFIDTESGKNFKVISGTSFQLFDNSPYFADNAWYGDIGTKVYDSNTGEIIKEFALDFKPEACGFNEDFSEIIIVSQEIEIKSSEERKFLKNDITKVDGYNVYNSAYIKQKEDGKGSTILTFNMKDGKHISSFTSPFSYSGAFGISIFKAKKDIFIAAWDVLVSIDRKGVSTAIECEDASFAYAANHTYDGRYMCVSSTKDGYLFDLIEGKSFKSFDLREGSEFAYSCDIISFDNKIFVLGKDYTISSLDYDDELKVIYKIDRGNENGFGVYYYNGFTKKEARDKEEAIINSALEAYKMDKIDLETDLGKSDFQIATFKTVEEAKTFIDILDDNGLQYIVKIAPIEE